MVTTALLFSTILVTGMPKKAPSPLDPALQARIVSPEVRADRTVTFRLRMPGAAKVTLNLEGSPSADMAKGENDIWSYTTKALAPDLYGYSFGVDGTTVLDPNNSLMKPNMIWQSNMVLVPGEKPELWEVQNVPHGKLTRHFYRSDSVGDQRDFYVYTPPGFDASGKTKYPVLYLLHGYSDTANGWSAVGQAHVIMDNLIAQKKAKPMLVVMPLGYGISLEEMFGPGPRTGNPFVKSYEAFGKALLGEVLPKIEKEYPVSAKREDRAIAGLSMGGAESLLVGLNNLDKFAYVGAFSSGGLAPNQLESSFPGLDAGKASALKAFWIACGTDDGLISFHRNFTKWLTDKGIKHKTLETPGGHVWMLWRRNLATFAEMLF